MKSLLYWCWIIALLGSLISIYYGEILMIEPCRMCWYQRIALFPLAFILGVGTYWEDRGVFRYACPLVIIGILSSVVQAISIHFPKVQICGTECAKPIFSIFGWISFPDLSVLGFLAIGVLLLISFGTRGTRNLGS
ncbi:MAG TPA: disulfide bond formation protein B [Chlamydiales bacterium]|nr:disulfide bond formation protein B [Chlamydiales bacterium]